MTNEQPCTREDLRIVINIPARWGVLDDGSMDIGDFWGEGDGDMDNFDSYECVNCGEFFTKDEDKDDAWQKALEHLKVKEAA